MAFAHVALPVDGSEKPGDSYGASLVSGDAAKSDARWAGATVGKAGKGAKAEGGGEARRGCDWCAVAAWAGLVASLALVGAGTAVLIMALTFSTQDPEFQILKVDLADLGLSKTGSLLFDFNDFALNLNGRVNVRAAVVNPNNHEVLVDDVAINLKLFDKDVGNASIPAFQLKKKGSKTTSFPFAIRNLPLIATGGRKSFIVTSFKRGHVDLQVRSQVDVQRALR
eukprot:TRINITY_DN2965_c0_g2_i4.p1 TRINITY_DN2965_c0_g2~~TRINITY_DN2965_c0_g2_i4.p1  ORF type:complete len:225 (-),score=19.69 TRINITY_DN2965_c0_g2_i4:176-850(-)